MFMTDVDLCCTLEDEVLYSTDLSDIINYQITCVNMGIPYGRV